MTAFTTVIHMHTSHPGVSPSLIVMIMVIHFSSKSHFLYSIKSPTSQTRINLTHLLLDNLRQLCILIEGSPLLGEDGSRCVHFCEGFQCHHTITQSWRHVELSLPLEGRRGFVGRVDDDGRWVGSGEAARPHMAGRHGRRDFHAHLGLGLESSGIFDRTSLGGVDDGVEAAHIHIHIARQRLATSTLLGCIRLILHGKLYFFIENFIEIR
mmetsp:Transcript_5777/g.8029  ORF Transcript_5777/g.8029 Transcript_5777/m.8029 type:complete len:210 (-) Transcript_5777:813-1442(-)